MSQFFNGVFLILEEVGLLLHTMTLRTKWLQGRSILPEGLEKTGFLKSICIGQALIFTIGTDLPTVQVPADTISCLMTMKDIRMLDDVEEHVLSDWFI